MDSSRTNRRRPTSGLAGLRHRSWGALAWALALFAATRSASAEEGALPVGISPTGNPPSATVLPTETPRAPDTPDAPRADGARPDPHRHDPHRHDPIDVDARPIVARSKVALVRPRRVLVEPDGNLLIADWGAGTVIRLAADDKATILATGLNEPAGLARDADGTIYVSTHAGGMVHAGSIVKIAVGGMQSLLVEGLTGPTALAIDASGNLFVASFHDDEVLRITPMGVTSVVANGVPSPSALALDGAGVLFVASSTEGTVYRLPPMGEIALLARGLNVPSDLQIDPEGHLIASNFSGAELTYIDAKGRTTPFAVVPKGTIAHAFDAAGNLSLLNWDLQLLMRVTMQLTVPCPHCGKPIPLRLRPKAREAKPEKPDRKEPFI